MSDFPVTIFHNPNCSTSRKALEAIRAAGHQPQVVEYAKAGWDRDRIEGLLRRMGAGPRAVLRAKGAQAEAAAALEGADDAAVLGAMVADPLLVERPIVETPKGVVLARPLERLDEVL